MIKYGYATYKRGVLYFDKAGWALVKNMARKRKQSPTTVVIDAIKRYIRMQKGTK